MPVIVIDKDGGYIVRADADVKTRTSIVFKDCVVSVPPDGYKKVLNIYVNPETGGLAISYED